MITNRKLSASSKAVGRKWYITDISKNKVLSKSYANKVDAENEVEELQVKHKSKFGVKSANRLWTITNKTRNWYIDDIYITKAEAIKEANRLQREYGKEHSVAYGVISLAQRTEKLARKPSRLL